LLVRRRLLKGLFGLFVIECRAVFRCLAAEYLTMDKSGEMHFLHRAVLGELGAHFLPKSLLVLFCESLHLRLL